MTTALDSFLAQLPVLAGVDEEARRLLAAWSGEERHEAGAVIVREGEPGDRVFLLHTGRVRVMKTAGGAEVTLAEFGPGAVFGEMALIECAPRSATAVALEPVHLFTLRGVDFYKLHRERPEQYAIVLLNLARDLSRRLRALDERFAAGVPG